MAPHVRKKRENNSTIGALIIAEVADELRCSETSVLRLIRNGQLRGVRIGTRKYIVLRDDLSRFLHGEGESA
jgi:excisionase family DNA binding protein